ncbi:Asp-tRNA(Asn)/Glu-tRNA(Gln) amidotransferase A subunit family amidase [Polynucleobacter sphagniphilus]|nr:Asp-tRNA(Asn)/Glu-tRNA(Gln) amidotransferase A subunit family amidase [Polynucleobacter sphagniphilus]
MHMKKIPGLREACNKIQAGELTPHELLSQCCDQADLLEPSLHAFLVRGSLEDLAKEVKPGPLSGIPVGVKDIIATTQFPTTNGSPIYKGNIPKEDAPIIAKIRQLGGVIFGKTVTTEFAWRHPGPTTNPWNAEHTPGGSSSGSAASVAAGIVPLALGSQTQGSIVRPAAFCGVVGFKASFGAVTREGAHPLAGSLDHIGFFTRSVDDAALAFQLLKNDSLAEEDAIILPDLVLNEKTGIPLFATPRIAKIVTPHDHLLSAEQKQALDAAADRLRAAGAIVQELTLPTQYWDAIADMNLMMDCEAAQIHETHLKENKELLSQHIIDLADRGSKHSSEAYLAARAKQIELKQSIAAFFEQYDGFLSVPASGEAPKGLTSTGDPIFCALWSFLGMPAINLPFTKSGNGLPLGIQLIGQYQEDAKLLSIAKFAEIAFAK